MSGHSTAPTDRPSDPEAQTLRAAKMRLVSGEPVEAIFRDVLEAGKRAGLEEAAKRICPHCASGRFALMRGSHFFFHTYDRGGERGDMCAATPIHEAIARAAGVKEG